MTAERRVLLVDEDPDVLAVTSEFLERIDPALAVRTVRTPRKAIELAAEDSFDVVVSDYRMQGMDGLELATAVGERAADVPCLLYTAADPSSVPAVIDDAVGGLVRKGTGRDQYEQLASLIRDVT